MFSMFAPSGERVKMCVQVIHGAPPRPAFPIPACGGAECGGSWGDFLAHGPYRITGSLYGHRHHLANVAHLSSLPSTFDNILLANVICDAVAHMRSVAKAGLHCPKFLGVYVRIELKRKRFVIGLGCIVAHAPPYASGGSGSARQWVGLA